MSARIKSSRPSTAAHVRRYAQLGSGNRNAYDVSYRTRLSTDAEDRRVADRVHLASVVIRVMMLLGLVAVAINAFTGCAPVEPCFLDAPDRAYRFNVVSSHETCRNGATPSTTRLTHPDETFTPGGKMPFFDAWDCSVSSTSSAPRMSDAKACTRLADAQCFPQRKSAHTFAGQQIGDDGRVEATYVIEYADCVVTHELVGYPVD